MLLLVIGSALREVAGEHEAHGRTFLGERRTALRYRLLSVDDRFAALVEDADAGVAVTGELVEIPDEQLPGLLAAEPPGVVQRPIELEDGQVVSAAFAEVDRLTGEVRDITAFGGFAAYLRSRD